MMETLDELINDWHYKTFEGSYIDAMRALRQSGYTPMTVKQIAEKRIKAVDSGNRRLIEGWLTNSFATPDAIAFCGDEVKVIPNCELLTDISKDAKLIDGELVLKEKQYKQLDGKTFQRSKLNLTPYWFKTKEEAKEHPIWQAEIGDILGSYTDMMFNQKERVRLSGTMGVYLDNIQKFPTLQFFSIYWYCDRSSLGILRSESIDSPRTTVVGMKKD